jgi:hypothetical protein
MMTCESRWVRGWTRQARTRVLGIDARQDHRVPRQPTITGRRPISTD